MDLANLLADRRAALRHSVAKVRRAGGISSVSCVFRWEHGTTPLRSQLRPIAKAYKLPLASVTRAWESQRAAARKARRT